MKSLYEILNETTRVYRKGKEISTKNIGRVAVAEIYGYPSTETAPISGTYEKVDMIFVDVLVDKEKAEKYKLDLKKVLTKYPDPTRLAKGPSYIELSPNLGLEQEGGLRVMALGKVLGLWDILSGKTLGLNDNESLQLAGGGLLNIIGYKI